MVFRLAQPHRGILPGEDCIVAHDICPVHPFWPDFVQTGDEMWDELLLRYNWHMIKPFADRQAQELYVTGKAKRFPPNTIKRATRKLEYINLATGLDDSKVPSSNRLHELVGDRVGQFSISVNDQ